MVIQRIKTEGNITKLLGDDFMITMEDLYPDDDHKLYSYIYVDAYREPKAKIINKEEFENKVIEFKNQFEDKVERN